MFTLGRTRMSLSFPLVWRPAPAPAPPWPSPLSPRKCHHPCFPPSHPSRTLLHSSAVSALPRPSFSIILNPVALPALSILLSFALATCVTLLKTKEGPPLQRVPHLRDQSQPSSSADQAFDIIIVGAGVAGSALAYTLGKDGYKVLVIERDLKEPKRIVGELLQPGGYLKLVELGLDDCVEDIDAQLVFGYALFKEGKDTKVGYPLSGQGAVVAGRSFHNGRFVQRMRTKAATLPT